MIALVLGIAQGWAAECAAPVSVDAWSARIDAAAQSYAALAGGTFVDAVEEASLDLPCLDGPVPPTLVARYHELVGLRAFARGEDAFARQAFAAARSADPAAELPLELVPAGHELRAWFAAAVPGGSEPVPAPADGALWFDGAPGSSRPTERPAVLQLADGAGRITQTTYLLPTDQLPAYVALEVPTTERSPRRWGWMAAGGAGLAVSGVLYGLATESSARFAGPLPAEYGREEILALRTRTNALVAASAAVGAAGAVGVVGFVARW